MKCELYQHPLTLDGTVMIGALSTLVNVQGDNCNDEIDNCGPSGEDDVSQRVLNMII